MPNGFPHLYQLDQSISNIRVFGDTFHLYSYLDRTFCKQTVKTLIICPKSRNGLVQSIKMGEIHRHKWVNGVQELSFEELLLQ